MKKLFYAAFIFTGLLFAIQTVSALPNPWVECKDNIYCGAKKAGFNFPVNVKKYNVRAMKGMMEISFPLSIRRNVIKNVKVINNGNNTGCIAGNMTGGAIQESRS